MRKYLILFLLAASPASAQIKTITGGGYQYPNGSPCTGCTLTLQLTSDATVSGTGQIVPKLLSYILDGSGNVPSGSTIWGNDQLTPNGTTYKASLAAVGGGQLWGPEYLSIAGASPINLAQLIPVANPAVFFSNPAVTNLNNTFTGSNNFTGPTFVSNMVQLGLVAGNLMWFSATPTVTAGFNGGSIGGNPQGTAAFSVIIGVGAAVSTGTVGLPTVTNFWTCYAQNVSRPAVIQLTASTNNSASFLNAGTTFAATNWTNGDAIHIYCYGR